ncbi:hypothetical protein [Virgibacillus phasianinus]|uniref:hypothetical protein n=1 Tax=Virgibacillus phasianinus TaxID=2017483 RepID=UPI001FE39926|nr:hypothetical protein [Virgibacillus phasianinus]
MMIDLLNTSVFTQQALHDAFPRAIFCLHTSKDQQEVNQKTFTVSEVKWDDRLIAVAGGITHGTLPAILKKYHPHVCIIGSAITKQTNRLEASAQFQRIIREVN